MPDDNESMAVFLAETATILRQRMPSPEIFDLAKQLDHIALPYWRKAHPPMTVERMREKYIPNPDDWVIA